MSRRRRRIALTAALFVGLALVGALAVLGALRSGETYTPGESVEGLTSQLTRALPDNPPRVAFTDVTEAAGIRFRHFPHRRTGQLPEDMGSGAAWGDYDDDGWPDLFLVDVARPLPGREGDDAGVERSAPGRSVLYRNLGDGTFRDVTDSAGIEHRAQGMAAAWGDYDGDGRIDLVVTAFGENALYRNEGDGTFSDRTAAAGLAGLVGFWSGAVWGDYDGDGDLDLYVTGYVRYSPGAGAGASALQYDVEVPASLNPSAFRPERNLLLENRGDGTFRDVAERAGVAGLEGRSLGAVWADFDEDGRLDLYVANDLSDNALYRNRGDGTFEDVSHPAMVADYRGAMGLAVGDWDGDGDMDLFITHWIAQENALFSNRLRDGAGSGGSVDGRSARPLQFIDEADRFGLGQVALDYIGWGTSFFDYDNDGRPDLFVVNGSTFPRKDRPELLEPMKDQLFWNRGPSEGFFDVSPVAGEHFARSLVGRGAAFADYDRDGDVDVLVMNHGAAPALLRNDGGDRAGRWIHVELRGRRLSPPVGARLRLVAGDATQVRWIGSQSSYLSQNSPSEHFGLGDHDVVDTLEVTWPDGERQTWTGIPADRAVRLVAGEAEWAELWAPEPVGGAPDGDRPPAASGGGAEPVPREAVLSFWGHYRSATRLRVAGRLEEAGRAYEAALAVDGSHEDALYYLGSVRLALGRVQEAREVLDRLVRVNPRSGRGHAQLGILDACPDAGVRPDLDRAAASFERAWAINREQTGVPLWLGIISLERGDLSGARRRFDEVLGSDPHSVVANYFGGYTAWAEGRGDEAIRRASAAVEGLAGERSVEPGLREGDTRASPAVFAAAMSCKWLEERLAPLAERAAPASSLSKADVDELYRGLDVSLETLRRGVRRSGPGGGR